MKKLFSFVFAFGAMLGLGFAQSAEAVFFSETGEKFTAFLNGVQVNEKPSNNVKATDLNEEFYQFSAQFEDSSLPAMRSNLMVKKGFTTTFKIKMNNKGKYVLRMFGESPLASSAPDASVELPAPPPPPAPPVPRESREVSTATPATTQTVTTTTTTKTSGSGDGESVTMKVDVEGFKMDVSMDVDDTGMETTQTTTTTTTTRTSEVVETTEFEGGRSMETETVVRTYNGYTGPTGCDWPSSEDEFNGFLQSMKSKTFSDSKMTLAKQYTKSHCMLSEQVKQVMQGFDFEDDKLDYAKFAYNYTYDQANYYKVNDAFEFEMTIEELDDYIQSK